MNPMLPKLFLAALGLRYHVHTEGLDRVAAKGRRGILFLPNHPAYIDPVIVTAVLLNDFQARPFADEDAVDNPIIRRLLGQVRAFRIPTVARHGQAAASKIKAMLEESVEALRSGDNVILYPAGRMMRSRFESVSGTSAVESIVQALPDVRIVIVTTRGLWGSRFSLYWDANPDLKAVLGKSVKELAANGFLFGPRRDVEIGFEEPTDFPRTGTRNAMNRFLEESYNKTLPAAAYVPYSRWVGEKPRAMAEPERAVSAGDLEQVSATTRELVTKYLQEVCGTTTMRDTDQLAHDLGLDSLKRGELLLWLEAQFGFPQGNTDSLVTVGDVMLAATGEVLAQVETRVDPAGPRWYAGDHNGRVEVAAGDTLAAAFLSMAAKFPNRVVVADPKSGMKSYRELVLGILALSPAVRALPGERLGIMLPASVAATLTYLTVMFAGRTPVMVNWTVGRRNLDYALEMSGTQKVLTARALVQKLKQQGVDLAGIEAKLVYLEDIGAALSRSAKALALVKSFVHWGELRSAMIAPTAAILFTSGSETVPKAVPLSHANVLADLRDTLSMVKLTGSDKLLGMLPPFHSFGLTIGVAAPLTSGIRTLYHANPTEGALLATLMQAYKGTLAVATPTFLQGILRASKPGQLANLRLAVVGAEACPPQIYQLLAERCPAAVLIEGYGITECSPIVSLSPPEDPRPGTIGRMLPSLVHALVDAETGEPVGDGAAGMLLLRGPTIFSGYLGEAPEPFVEHAGERWYKTGDIVRAGTDGVFSFVGRLKRFIKLGGEMISLPAIEAALQEKLSSPSDEGPILAVLATSGDHPELVLYTTTEVDREQANKVLREAGLSPLYNLRRVEKVDAIPVLGTGKTDYRSLQDKLNAQ
jgi:acyl-CoA synthetase (AMP-forming)/AMP-acid ligase II/1-acyl-sn-glycerol-3-phosphate acyltransferase/acyl carrier protein